MILTMTGALFRANAPDGVTVSRDIIYKTADGRDLRLDLYWRPNAASPTPVTLWIHGGAWLGGDRTSGVESALTLLEDGFAVASLDYRLSHEAIFPAQIEDCKDAVRWLRANAERHNLGTERIGAWGHSAGGHLAALLGTVGEGDTRVHAVCSWSGPSDFARAEPVSDILNPGSPESPYSLLVGGPIGERADAVAAANPITHMAPDSPPFLIMHGKADTVVSSSQSSILHDALVEAGIDSTLVLFEGAGHGFEGVAREDLFAPVRQFFSRHLASNNLDPK